MATFYTDSFTRADENPITTPWSTVTGGGVKIVSNQIQPTTLGTRCVSRYGAFAHSDMKATITLATFINGQAGACVRIASVHTCYQTTCGGEFQLDRVSATAFTNLGVTSGNNPAAGRTATCSAIGSTIKAYADGVEVLSVTNSVVLTGSWGVDLAPGGANLTDVVADDITFENFGPVFIAAGTEGSAASGNITPGLPGGTNPLNLQNDDVLIMAYHGSDQVAVTVDAAWTQIAQGNGGGTTSRLAVWYHRYAGSSPSAVITHAAGQSPIAGIAAFRGCKTTGSPVNVSSAIAGGTADTTISHTGVTSTVDYCTLLAINGVADDNDRTLLTGYVSAWDDAAGGGPHNAMLTTAGTPDGSVSMFVKGEPIVNGVGTGTIAVTQSAIDPWAAMLVALEPTGVVVAVLVNTVPLLMADRRRRMH
jgi:hypothetical protein